MDIAIIPKRKSQLLGNYYILSGMCEKVNIVNYVKDGRATMNAIISLKLVFKMLSVSLFLEML